MNEVTTAEPANTRLFVLALGLLVGFVIGFIMLLSWLPVDSSLSGYRVDERDTRSRDYDFYTELPRTRSDASPVIQVKDVTKERPVVQPATRVVPGSVQIVSAPRPVSSGLEKVAQRTVAQQSYYLQAGNFEEPDDAERARATVLMLGLDASIVVRNDSNGQAGHRVRIGPFFDPSRLTEAKLRLRSNNIPYEIIRVTS